MSGAYEWDKSGPVDTDLAGWERELAGYRYRPAPYRRRGRVWNRRGWVPLAVAASLLLAVGMGWREMALRSTSVTAAVGNVRINGAGVAGGTRMSAGDRLTTGPGARATVQVGKLGRVELAEASSLVLVAEGGGRKRVRLEHGGLRAGIYAEPYTFTVETPGGRVDDLGCGYEIRTDSAGRGFLRVTEGWVRLRSRGVEALVVEGAEVALLTPSGPGVPVMKDAGAGLRLIAAAAAEGGEISLVGLAGALLEAENSDTITLLNLLWRVPEDRRALIYKRLAALHPPPAEVTWERVRNGDWTVVAAWWPELGFRKTVKLPPVFYQN